MTRSKKLKKKDAKKQETDKRETSKSEQEDTSKHEKNVVSFMFKSDEIVIIMNILKITELNETNALLGAVVLGKFNIVKKLLLDGYDLNKRFEDGKTATMWAVKLKLVSMADFLFRRGADVNMSDTNGNNVLLVALQTPSWDQDEFIDFWFKIQDTEIDVNHTNELGNSVLHYLVKRHWDAAIDVIATSSNVNLNRITGKGVTPLMIACTIFHEDSIVTLLKHKADKGCTALCYAISYFVENKLKMPNRSMEKLMETFDRKTSKRSFNAYLMKRFQIIKEPLEKGNETFSTTQNIVTFTIRCLFNVKAFLDMKIFKILSEILEKYIENEENVVSCVGILSEILRFCECCMSEISYEDLYSSLYDSGILDICLKAIKKHNTGVNARKLMLPIFLTCHHSSSKTFIKKNQNVLMHYYKISKSSAFPIISLYPDDKHVDLVRESINNFSNVLNETKQNFEKVKYQKKKGFDKRTKSLEPYKKFENNVKKKRSEENLVKDVPRSKKEGKAFGEVWPESHELVYESPTNQNWNEYLKEGCDLFGVTECPEEPKGVREIKIELGSGDSEENLLETLKELEEKLNQVLNKYDKYWEKDFKNGYPEIFDLDESLKLKLVLPDLESHFSNMVKNKWKNLVETIKTNYKSRQDLCKSTIEELVSNMSKLVDETKFDEKNEESEEDSDYFDDTSSDEWLRTDNLLAAADAYNRTNPSEENKKLELICTECRENTEPFISKNRYHEKISNLNSAWDEHVQSGNIYDLVFTENLSECKIKEGSFGDVYLGLDLCTKNILAVKKIPRETLAEQMMVETLEFSLKSLIDLHSDFIVPYTHLVQVKNELFLATPLFERNLSEYLMMMKSAKFYLNVANLLIKQVINGIEFLHSRRFPVIHGNLKPSNILIDCHGKLRLSEFGLGNVIYQQAPPSNNAQIWWAPETYWFFREHKKLFFGMQSDIYVCGMIIHYLATAGGHPFGQCLDEIITNMENFKPNFEMENEEIRDMVEWMMLEKTNERPSVNMVLRHVFFWDKDKRWRFILTCAGVSTDNKTITMPTRLFHECLDRCAKENKVQTKWVKLVEKQLTEVIPRRLEYSDTISGLLKLFKDTLPSSVSWFLSVFPTMPLTLYRLLENTIWFQHKDFAEFVNY